MQLLDRYLSAVRFWLPGGQKDDIIAELSEDLRSAIADEEANLGRALTDGELAQLLKRRGHPLVVAGAYTPQRALIGPVLFPVYVFALKIVAACFVVPWIATWAAILFAVPSMSGAAPGSGFEVRDGLGSVVDRTRQRVRAGHDRVCGNRTGADANAAVRELGPT
jgi:hypothetical protein